MGALVLREMKAGVRRALGDERYHRLWCLSRTDLASRHGRGLRLAARRMWEWAALIRELALQIPLRPGRTETREKLSHRALVHRANRRPRTQTSLAREKELLLELKDLGEKDEIDFAPGASRSATAGWLRQESSGGGQPTVGR